MKYNPPKNSFVYQEGILANINWFQILLIIIFPVVLVIFLMIVYKFIKKSILKNKYHNHSVFLIRLPKEKPQDQQGGGPNMQEIREEIAKGETIFSSIGGLKAQRGIKARFFGRDDHFSFEMVASQNKIAFYVVAPHKMARYLEQKIHAYYPEASIEEVKDYNVFSKEGISMGSTVRTKRNFVFPIKTYNRADSDLMNSLINVMSKLGKDESMVLQVLVRSSKPVWHSKINKIIREVNNGKKVQEAINTSGFNKTMGFIGDMFSSATPNKNQENHAEVPNKISAMEEEMLKGMEEKNSKAGLDVNLKVIVNTHDKGQGRAYLENIGNAFSDFNYYEYGNSFKLKNISRKQNALIQSFIYRRFSEKDSFILNTEELASIFHLPLPQTETPNILWLNAKHASAPSDLPDEGIVLGTNNYRGVDKEIRIKRSDRRRHTYIIGKSGTGKSKFIASMAIQDIMNGEGVGVLDPHGDLIEDIIKRIPPERAEDVIIFAPGDIKRPLGLNLIEYDERYPEQKTFVINEIIKIFDKLYDLKSTGGPMFEQYMRNALLLIMSDPESGSTLMEIPKVLADTDFRNMKLEKCNDSTVVDFWRKQAEKAGGDAALANIVPYITSKLTQFVSNDIMRPIIGQQKSAFNLRDVMDKQKILLIDLSKGRVGEMNAHLLGLILVGKILMSALSRTDMPEEKRKDFYLYIDEFQNFTTDSVNTILSEARKYGLNLIMAHQYLGQLVVNNDTSIKDAVFGNVGTWILFKIGVEDAEIMEREFSPVFNQYDLINIEKYTTYIKLLIDNTSSRPFTMRTIWPPIGVPERDRLNDKIKTLSRLKYGRDRNMVESEIKQRIKGIM